MLDGARAPNVFAAIQDVSFDTVKGVAIQGSQIMRILKGFLLIFAVAIATGAAFAETTIKAMSFNVRYGTAPDGANAWHQRKDLVIDVIRQCDPDIIGTQECLDFQADYIVQALPEYRWFGVGREADGRGEFMAVLYRPRVLSPIESGNFWLSETPDVPGSSSWNSACNRMVTWARFYHIESKQFFHFYNTHLDHKSEPARQGGATVLAGKLAALPANTPAIVTGDFNSVAGNSEAYRILAGAGLSDAWSAASERVGPSVTWCGWKPPREGVDERIDWILTRGPVSVSRCETVVVNRDGRYPSDHFPVIATLTIKTGG